ncbi:MAG: hypothetical protein ACLU4J_03410 [Butyricimonas paravirosa]
MVFVFIWGNLIDYPYDHPPEALKTNTDKPRDTVNTVYNIFLEEKTREERILKELEAVMKDQSKKLPKRVIG